MTDDRDPVVARALRDLPVPDHGPGFWSELERRLADEAFPSRTKHLDALAAPAAGPTGAPRHDDDDEDVPVVVPLADRPQARRHLWSLSVAAVVVLVVGLALTLAVRAPSSERVRIADDPERLPPADEVAPVTSEPGAGAATPDGAVVAWLDAVGAGDTGTAAALTGPRSRAYVEALTGGASLEGFLTEAGEGYGAWADSPDRSTTEVELPTSGEEIAIVIVSGTWTGEGGTAFRTDAIPAVRTSSGRWLVEAWAIDPGTGGRIEVRSPAGKEDGTFQGLAPDGVLSAWAPGGGTFHFSLDDQPATAVPGQKTSGGAQAQFDPPGAMAHRTHLFVIAYVDGPTLIAIAGTFPVEG